MYHEATKEIMCLRQLSDAQSLMFLKLGLFSEWRNHLKVYQPIAENLILTSDTGALFHIRNNIEVNFPG